MDNKKELSISQCHTLFTVSLLVSSESSRNIKHISKQVVMNIVISQLAMLMEDKNVAGILGV